MRRALGLATTMVALVLASLFVLPVRSALAEPGGRDVGVAHPIVCPTIPAPDEDEDCVGTANIEFSLGTGTYKWRLHNGTTVGMQLVRVGTIPPLSESGQICRWSVAQEEWTFSNLTDASNSPTVGGAQPADMPADKRYWFRSSLTNSPTNQCDGADPGPPGDPVEGNCAVLAEQSSEDTHRARLVVRILNPHESDVVEADHGDGSAAVIVMPGVAYWHYFPARTPAADGDGYEVVYLLTREGQPVTACGVDVNFYDDTLDTSEFEDGDPEEDDDGGETESCGFNLICWLKKLFVPSGEELAENANEVKDAASENWPLGPAIGVGEDVAEVGDDVESGANSGESYADPYVSTAQGPECRGLVLPLEFGEDFEGDAELDVFGGETLCEEDSHIGTTTGGWLGRAGSLVRAATSIFAFFAAVGVVRNAVDRTVGNG